ncbi:hypothetical protein SRHO_G00308770 [Serrasalmus rhombeus]
MPGDHLQLCGVQLHDTLSFETLTSTTCCHDFPNIRKYHSSTDPHITGSSVISRASQLSRTSSVRSKLKAEREALLARATAVKMKQELEQEELRLRVKKEQWQIETELAASSAKLKVYEEFEDVHESVDDLLEHESTPSLARLTAS